MNTFKEGDRVVVLAAMSRIDTRITPGSLGKIEVAREYLGTIGVRLDDDRFVSLNPGDVVKVAAETERMPVAHMSELQVGDVVETAYSRDTLHAYVTRVKPAPEPEPTHGFGTAYVFGNTDAGVTQKRYRGFRSAMGKFYFLSDEGTQSAAYPHQFENFRLED